MKNLFIKHVAVTHQYWTEWENAFVSPIGLLP